MTANASKIFGLIAALVCSFAAAQSPTDSEQKANVPAHTVPYSSFASPESRKVFELMLKYGREAPPFGKSLPDSRAYYDKINTDRAHRMEALYPVAIVDQKIGGVPTQVVTSKQ